MFSEFQIILEHSKSVKSIDSITNHSILNTYNTSLFGYFSINWAVVSPMCTNILEINFQAYVLKLRISNLADDILYLHIPASWHRRTSCPFLLCDFFVPYSHWFSNRSYFNQCKYAYKIVKRFWSDKTRKSTKIYSFIIQTFGKLILKLIRFNRSAYSTLELI